MAQPLSIEKMAWLQQLASLVGATPVASPATSATTKESTVPMGLVATTRKGQRRPAKATTLDVNNYIALVNGITHLVIHWKQPGPLDVSPSDEHDLMPMHREMLLGFHTALVLLRTSPQSSLELWEKIAPGLRTEVERSGPAGMGSSEIARCREQPAYAEKSLFVAGAYGEAKRNAEAGSSLEAPDTAQMAARFVKAGGELKEASKLFEESLKLASGVGQLAGVSAPKEINEIFELVMLPGTIEEKLQYARKHGLAGTAVEMVGKVTGATGTIIRHVGEIGEKVSEARKAIVLGRGSSAAAKETAEKLEKVAGKFKKLANVAKALGTAASYAAVIADGFKLISALRDKDYDEALRAGADLAVDAAPILLGEELAGPLAVLVGVVQAELEAIKLAAGFIRFCKDETVRQAAEHFIKQCNVIAQGGARSLVADCSLLLGASNAGVQDAAFKQANREAALVSKGIQALASHVASDDKHAIGAYPGVVASLGQAALSAMMVTFDEKDGVLLVAQQIADVFQGANEMAKYVKRHYTN